MFIRYHLDNTGKQEEVGKTMSCTHCLENNGYVTGVFLSLFLSVQVYLYIYICVLQNLGPTVYTVLDTPLLSSSIGKHYQIII